MGIENKFERPTPQQRISELKEVAIIVGSKTPAPTSIIFNERGLTQVIVGIEKAQDETAISKQKDPEGKSGKHKKAPPPIKENQLRHTQNLSGLNGWHRGILYVNGRPMNRGNGNGKH